MKIKLILATFLSVLTLWLLVIVILEKNQNEVYVHQTTQFSELVTYYSLGQYKNVITNAEKIYSYDPGAFDVLLLKAKSYYELNDYENTIITIEQLFIINPYFTEDVELLIILANSLINSESYSKLFEVMIQIENLHIPASSFRDYQQLKNTLQEKGIQ